MLETFKERLRDLLRGLWQCRLWLLALVIALVVAGVSCRATALPKADPSLPVTVAEPDTRLAEAHAANPDTVAWITIPGTSIDCPVQQYSDNDYYLRRDALGNTDQHGCVYADYECWLTDSGQFSRNLILYGHTFDDDYNGGFEDLHSYRQYDFGVEHPYIYVSLADAQLTYRIFSVGVCDTAADVDCITADPDDAAFATILAKAKDRCAFDYGVTADVSDHILTLSTCTASTNSRLLVVAKLVDTVIL